MRRHRCFSCFCLFFALTGCSASGEHDARLWVASRITAPSPDASLGLPPLLDTPPSAYVAKAVADPFSSARIGQSRSVVASTQNEAIGRVYFADAALEDLRVVGVLEAQGQHVALIEGGSGFANAKVGDRLGNQQQDVVEISKKGIRLRKANGSESWMPISRRGR